MSHRTVHPGLAWAGLALVSAGLLVGLRTDAAGVAVAWSGLLGHVLLGTSLVAGRAGRRRGGDATRLLEASTVAVGVVLATWVVLVGPLLRSGGPVHGPVEALVLVPGAVLLAAVPRPWGLRRRLLVSAAALLALAGVVQGTTTAAWALGVEALGVLAWVAASARPGREVRGPRPVTKAPRAAQDPPSGRAARARVLASAGVVLVGPLLLVWQQLSGRTLDVWPVVTGSLVLYALVVARVVLALEVASTDDERARELQDQLTFEATHDALTLLPNRSHGLALAEEALVQARATGAMTALLFVDLDGFKQVNDTFGHETGDQVLRRVAERLGAALRAEDVPVRLGGDEFVVLLRDIGDAEAACRVAERLVVRISVAMQLPSGRARVGASIGVAVDLDGRTPVETLLQEADAAAYAAKAGGKGQARLYDDSMRSDAAERAQVEGIVRDALAAGEMTVHYQPVVDTPSGAVEGFEALVRWDRPGEGLLVPAQFLPLAASSELISDIDAWVLREAVGQVAAWTEALGLPGLYVSVNVSRQYAARARIVRDVVQVLDETGVAPHQVVLEVHEAVLADEDRTVPHLRALRERGVRVAVDDFGSSFQAVAALAELPVDVVKLDPRVLHPDPSCGDLLPLVLQGARAVGLPAVAQGVEHELQVARLRSLDCGSLQGFALGRPAPATEVVAVLAEQAGDPASDPATSPGPSEAGGPETRVLLDPVRSPAEVTSPVDALPA